MRFKISFYIFLFCIVLISCVDSSSKAIFYYENGNIRKEVFYKDNQAYKEVQYYESGKKKSLTPLTDGVRNGTQFTYYENGILESKRDYIKGKIEGYEEWYREDRTLEIRAFWLAGQQYGSVFYYKPNGKFDLYNVTDFKGQNFYILGYDSLGNIMKQHGHVFSPLLLYSSDQLSRLYIWRDTLSSKGTDKILITVAQPPKTITKINLEIERLTGTVYRPLSDLPIKDCSAVFEAKELEAGKYRMKIYGHIEDAKTKSLIKSDSLIKTFVVL